MKGCLAHCMCAASTTAGLAPQHALLTCGRHAGCNLAAAAGRHRDVHLYSARMQMQKQSYWACAFAHRRQEPTVMPPTAPLYHSRAVPSAGPGPQMTYTHTHVPEPQKTQTCTCVVHSTASTVPDLHACTTQFLSAPNHAVPLGACLRTRHATQHAPPPPLLLPATHTMLSALRLRWRGRGRHWIHNIGLEQLLPAPGCARAHTHTSIGSPKCDHCMHTRLVCPQHSEGAHSQEPRGQHHTRNQAPATHLPRQCPRKKERGTARHCRPTTVPQHTASIMNMRGAHAQRARVLRSPHMKQLSAPTVVKQALSTQPWLRNAWRPKARALHHNSMLEAPQNSTQSSCPVLTVCRAAVCRPGAGGRAGRVQQLHCPDMHLRAPTNATRGRRAPLSLLLQHPQQCKRRRGQVHAERVPALVAALPYGCGCSSR